jgi:ribonucleoside-diphosphate reductase beta chain
MTIKKSIMEVTHQFQEVKQTPLKFKVLSNCLHDVDCNNPDEINQLMELLKQNNLLNKIIDRSEQTTNSVDLSEPLLNPNNKRFTVFPIQNQKIWKMYKRQQAAFWKAEEISFAGLKEDMATLNPDEQHFIKWILAFFAASDGIVNMNIGERFSREVQNMEASICYDFQKMMENIHGEVYSLMLDNVIEDSREKEFLFNAIQTIPTIKEMADWAFKWINSDKSFSHRVVAFALVEGVFFSGAFASIFWFKKYKNRGKLFFEGLVKSNEFIARDEGMHCDFACLIYNELNSKLPSDEIYQITDEAVKIATSFTNDSLKVDLIGMNKEMMSDYIKYIADRLLVSLGHQKHYNIAKNPFRFMETIGLLGKTNFFESRPTEYQDANIMNKSKEKIFRKLEEF